MTKQKKTQTFLLRDSHTAAIYPLTVSGAANIKRMAAILKRIHKIYDYKTIKDNEEIQYRLEILFNKMDSIEHDIGNSIDVDIWSAPSNSDLALQIGYYDGYWD